MKNRIVSLLLIIVLISPQPVFALAPGSGVGEVGDLVGLLSHRFPKYIREALTEELERQGYASQDISKAIWRGLTWTDGSVIGFKDDALFNIAAEVLSKTLKRTISADAVKAVLEYHEEIHRRFHTEKGSIKRLQDELSRTLGAKRYRDLLEYFQNQYGEYKDEMRLVEELAVNLYVERLLGNPLRLLDEYNNVVVLEEIIPIIETHTKDIVDRIDVKKLRFGNVLNDLYIERFSQPEQEPERAPEPEPEPEPEPVRPPEPERPPAPRPPEQVRTPRPDRPSRPVRPPAPRPPQRPIPEVRPGMQVRIIGHEVLGIGTVISLEGNTIVIEFPSGKKELVWAVVRTRIEVVTQALSPQELWQRIVELDNRINSAATFKERIELMAERNRYRAKLWELLEATRTGELLRWEEFARRIGIDQNQLRTAIYDYFIEITDGDISKIAQLMEMAEVALSVHLSQYVGREKMHWVRAVAKTKKGEGLSEEERLVLVRELITKYLADSTFISLSFKTIARFHMTRVAKEQGGCRIHLARIGNDRIIISEGLLENIGKDKEVVVTTEFDPDYGWLFVVTGEGKTLYYKKTPDKCPLDLIDPVQETILDSIRPDSGIKPRALTAGEFTQRYGPRVITEMVRWKRFNESNLNLYPFKMTAVKAIDRGMFHFGRIEDTRYATGYRLISLQSNRLIPEKEYRIQPYFSTVLGRWVFVVTEVGVEDVTLIFSGREIGEEIHIYQLEGEELDKVLSELGKKEEYPLLRQLGMTREELIELFRSENWKLDRIWWVHIRDKLPDKRIGIWELIIGTGLTDAFRERFTYVYLRTGRSFVATARVFGIYPVDLKKITDALKINPEEIDYTEPVLLEVLGKTKDGLLGELSKTNWNLGLLYRESLKIIPNEQLTYLDLLKGLGIIEEFKAEVEKRMTQYSGAYELASSFGIEWNTLKVLMSILKIELRLTMPEGKDIWASIVELDGKIKGSASFKERTELVAERNRYRQQLWGLLKTTRTGKHLQWVGLARRLGIDEAQLRQAIWDYFVEAANGDIEEIIKISGFARSVVKMEITINVGMSKVHQVRELARRIPEAGPSPSEVKGPALDITPGQRLYEEIVRITEDGKYSIPWSDIARSHKMEKQDLVREVVIYLAQVHNGDLTQMARALWMKLDSFKANIISAYGLTKEVQRIKGVAAPKARLKDIWRQIVVLDKRIDKSTSFQERLKLMEERNRYREQLWDLLKADILEKYIPWEKMAGELRIKIDQLRIVIYDYFIEVTNGDIERIAGLMDRSTGAVSVELKKYKLTRKLHWARAVKKAKDGEGLNEQERLVMVRELLESLKDSTFPSFSFETVIPRRGACRINLVNIGKKRISISKGLRENFNIGRKITVKTIFDPDYGWLFFVTDGEKGLYYRKIDGKDSLDLIDPNQEAILDSIESKKNINGRHIKPRELSGGEFTQDYGQRVITEMVRCNRFDDSNLRIYPFQATAFESGGQGRLYFGRSEEGRLIHIQGTNLIDGKTYSIIPHFNSRIGQWVFTVTLDSQTVLVFSGKKKKGKTTLYQLKEYEYIQPKVKITPIEKYIAEGFERGEFKGITAAKAIGNICRHFGFVRATPERKEAARVFFTYVFFEYLKGLRKKLDSGRQREYVLSQLKMNYIKRHRHDLEAVLLRYYGSYEEVFNRNKEKISEILGFEVDYQRDIRERAPDDIREWLLNKTGRAKVPKEISIFVGDSRMFTLFRGEDLYMNFTGLEPGEYRVVFEEGPDRQSKYAWFMQGDRLVQRYHIVKDGQLLAQKIGGKETGLAPIPLIITDTSTLIRKWLLEDGPIPEGKEEVVKKYGQILICGFTDLSIIASQELHQFRGQRIWISFSQDESGKNKFALIWRDRETANVDPYGYLRKFYIVKDGVVCSQQNRVQPMLYTFKDNRKIIVEGKTIRRREISIGEYIDLLLVNLASPDTQVATNSLEALRWVRTVSGLDRLRQLLVDIVVNPSIQEQVRRFYEELLLLQAPTDEFLEGIIKGHPRIKWDPAMDGHVIIQVIFPDLHGRGVRIEKERLFKLYYKLLFFRYLETLLEKYSELLLDQRKREICNDLKASNLSFYQAMIKYWDSYEKIFTRFSKEIENILGFSIDYRVDIHKKMPSSRELLIEWLQGITEEIPEGFSQGVSEHAGIILINAKGMLLALLKNIGSIRKMKSVYVTFLRRDNNKIAQVWVSEEMAGLLQEYILARDGEILAQKIDGKLTGRTPEPLIKTKTQEVEEFLLKNGPIPNPHEIMIGKNGAVQLINTEDIHLFFSAGLSKYAGKRWATYEIEGNNKLIILWLSKEEAKKPDGKYIRRVFLVKDGICLAQEINGKKTGKKPVALEEIIDITQIETYIADGFEKGEFKGLGNRKAVANICRHFGIKGKGSAPERKEVARIFYTYQFFEYLKGLGKEAILERLGSKYVQGHQKTLFANLILHYGSYEEVFIRNKEKIKQILGFEIDYQRDIRERTPDDVRAWLLDKTGNVPVPKGYSITITGVRYTLFRSEAIYLDFTGLVPGVYQISFEEGADKKDKYVSFYKDSELFQKYQVVKGGQILAQKIDGVETGLAPIPEIIRDPSEQLRRWLLENGHIPEGREVYVGRDRVIKLCELNDLTIRIFGVSQFIEQTLWISYSQDESGKNKFITIWRDKETSQKAPDGYLARFYIIKDGEILAQRVNGKDTGRSPESLVKTRTEELEDFLLSNGPIPKGHPIPIGGKSGLVQLIKTHRIWLYFSADLKEYAGERWATYEVDGNNRFIIIWASEEEARREGGQYIRKVYLVKDGVCLAQEINGERTGRKPVAAEEETYRLVGDIRLKEAEIAKGIHNEYLLRCLDDPKTREVAKEALKLMRNEDKVIDLVKALDPLDPSFDAANRNLIILEILEAIGIANEMVFKRLTLFLAYRKDEVRKKSIEVLRKLKRLQYVKEDEEVLGEYRRGPQYLTNEEINEIESPLTIEKLHGKELIKFKKEFPSLDKKTIGEELRRAREEGLSIDELKTRFKRLVIPQKPPPPPAPSRKPSRIELLRQAQAFVEYCNVVAAKEDLTEAEKLEKVRKRFPDKSDEHILKHLRRAKARIVWDDDDDGSDPNMNMRGRSMEDVYALASLRYRLFYDFDLSLHDYDLILQDIETLIRFDLGGEPILQSINRTNLMLLKLELRRKGENQRLVLFSTIPKANIVKAMDMLGLSIEVITREDYEHLVEGPKVAPALLGYANADIYTHVEVLTIEEKYYLWQGILDIVRFVDNRRYPVDDRLHNELRRIGLGGVIQNDPRYGYYIDLSHEVPLLEGIEVDRLMARIIEDEA